MQKTISNHFGQSYDFDVHYSHSNCGYGQFHINCEVSYLKERKTFKYYTNDSEFIDQISDMKADGISHEDIQEKYDEKAYNILQDSIHDWCEAMAIKNIPVEVKCKVYRSNVDIHFSHNGIRIYSTVVYIGSDNIDTEDTTKNNIEAIKEAIISEFEANNAGYTIDEDSLNNTLDTISIYIDPICK